MCGRVSESCRGTPTALTPTTIPWLWCCSSRHLPTAHGGLLEYVPHTVDLDTLQTGTAHRAHHRPGDGYLLRSDTTAHRVTPLRHPGLRRTVLNFAYTTSDRQRAVTPSSSQLY
jgi:hypothetical protein